MLVNLTPHPITIVYPDQTTHEFPSAGVVRCEETTTPSGDVDGIPCRRVALGQVQGLPDKKPGTWYVVSRIVAEARPDRDDLRFPADLVRDETGRIVGCRALGTL